MTFPIYMDINPNVPNHQAVIMLLELLASLAIVWGPHFAVSSRFDDPPACSDGEKHPFFMGKMEINAWIFSVDTKKIYPSAFGPRYQT